MDIPALELLPAWVALLVPHPSKDLVHSSNSLEFVKLQDWVVLVSVDVFAFVVAVVVVAAAVAAVVVVAGDGAVAADAFDAADANGVAAADAAP